MHSRNWRLPAMVIGFVAVGVGWGCPAAIGSARSPRERLRHTYLLEKMAAQQQQFEKGVTVLARVEARLPVHNIFRSIAYSRGTSDYDVVTLGNMLEERWYDRARNAGWERNGGFVNDLAPNELEELRQSAAHTTRLLADLDKPGAQAREAGMRKLPNGLRARRVQFLPPRAAAPPDGSATAAPVPTDFYLHPQTDRLLALGYRDRSPRRGIVSERLTLITAWMPPRALPFAYPRKLATYEDGLLVERVTNEKVDCKPPDARLFARPTEKDRFASSSLLPTRVPVAFTHGYCVVVARINGAKFTGRFLLDTGAASSSLGLRLARRLGLRLGPAVTNYSGLGNFRSRLSRVQSIRVGGGEVRDARIDVVMDDALDQLTLFTEGPLDGILGNDFWRAFLMTLDYGATRGPTLILNRPDAPPPPGTPIPFFVSGGGPAVVAHIPGAPDLTMTVDTGAPTSWLPPRYATLFPAKQRAEWEGFWGEQGGTRLVWLPEITLKGVGYRVSGVGEPKTEGGKGGREEGETQSPNYPTTQLPNYPTPDTQHPTPDNAVILRDEMAWSVALPHDTRPTGSLLSDEYEGLFGSDLLRHFRVSFDYRRGVMTFERLSQPALSHGDYVGVGIWPEFHSARVNGQTVQRVFVQKLWPFSPAALAGVRVGDELVEIAEKSTESLSESEVSDHLWRGKEGRSLRLSVRPRRGERRALELEYRRLF